MGVIALQPVGSSWIRVEPVSPALASGILNSLNQGRPSLIFKTSPAQLFLWKTKGHTLPVFRFLSLWSWQGVKCPCFSPGWSPNTFPRWSKSSTNFSVSSPPVSAHSQCSRNKTAYFLRTLDAASHVYDLTWILPLRCLPALLLIYTLFWAYVFFCAPVTFCTQLHSWVKHTLWYSSTYKLAWG